MNPRRIARTAVLSAIPLTLISISLPAAAPEDPPIAQQRLTAAEIGAMAAAAKPAANPGVQMTNLVGDPTKPGLYTVRVAIAAHTQARPHIHRDNRSVTV